MRSCRCTLRRVTHVRSTSGIALLQLAREFATAEQQADIDRRIAAMDPAHPADTPADTEPAVVVAQPRVQDQQSDAEPQVDAPPAAVTATTTEMAGFAPLPVCELYSATISTLPRSSAARRTRSCLTGPSLIVGGGCASRHWLACDRDAWQLDEQAGEGGARGGQAAQPRQGVCALPAACREDAK